MKTNVRRNARVYCGMPARAVATTGTIRGVVRNLSCGGMFFLTPGAFRVGQTVDMLLDLPGKQPTKATGEVRYQYKYTDGQGVGVKFVRLGADDLATIAEYVNRRTGPISNS